MRELSEANSSFFRGIGWRIAARPALVHRRGVSSTSATVEVPHLIWPGVERYLTCS